jgi:aminoglycoside 6'-N-acetyltransferase I
MNDARTEMRELLEPQNILRAAVDDDGRVLGFIGSQPAYDNHTWELHPLAVAPEAQGRGVGAALVRDLETLLRDKGVVCIMLGADDENNQTSLGGIDLYPDVWEHVARVRNLKQHPYAFYQKMGYAIVGVLPDANGFGKPDIYMAKRIGNMP